MISILLWTRLFCAYKLVNRVRIEKCFFCITDIVTILFAPVGTFYILALINSQSSKINPKTPRINVYLVKFVISTPGPDTFM